MSVGWFIPTWAGMNFLGALSLPAGRLFCLCIQWCSYMDAIRTEGLWKKLMCLWTEISCMFLVCTKFLGNVKMLLLIGKIGKSCKVRIFFLFYDQQSSRHNFKLIPLKGGQNLRLLITFVHSRHATRKPKTRTLTSYCETTEWWTNSEARSYRLLRRLREVPPPNHSRLIFSRPVDSSLFPHVAFDAPRCSFSLVNGLRILIFKQLHSTKWRIDSKVVLPSYQRWLYVV